MFTKQDTRNYKHGLIVTQERHEGKLFTRKTHWVEGVKDGTEILYDANGSVCEYSEWAQLLGLGQHGLLWQMCINMTHLTCFGYWVDDSPDGWVYSWHDETGKPKRVTFYKNGRPDGIEKRYDANGTMCTEVQYSDGVEVSRRQVNLTTQ